MSPKACAAPSPDRGLLSILSAASSGAAISLLPNKRGGKGCATLLQHAQAPDNLSGQRVHRSAVSHPSGKGAWDMTQLEMPGQMRQIRGWASAASVPETRRNDTSQKTLILQGRLCGIAKLCWDRSREHREKRKTMVFVMPGGEGGIRTPDGLAPMPHFECGAFNRSATSPRAPSPAQAGH